jgi:hypothetical protein
MQSFTQLTGENLQYLGKQRNKNRERRIKRKEKSIIVLSTF